jgi:hypothetical protein
MLLFISSAKNRAEQLYKLQHVQIRCLLINEVSMLYKYVISISQNH